MWLLGWWSDNPICRHSGRVGRSRDPHDSDPVPCDARGGEWSGEGIVD